MARPFPSQWGGGKGVPKQTSLVALGSDLSTHLQMSSSLEGEAWGSCGPLRRKLKGLAPGLTQILDN